MNRMQAWSGMFAVSDIEGVISPDYSIFQPKVPTSVRYFETLFKTPLVVDEFARRSKGIGSGFNRLYTPDFASVSVISPPLQEQTAIVRFVAQVGGRIQRYIRAKQKLIKLLEEQKQAIIHRAVTRGLDPSVRLRRSGVEWLGDVPKHWSVSRLKSLIRRIDQGISPQAENCPAERERWGVLKSGCVNHGIFRQTEHKQLPLGFAFDRQLEIVEGDVLVSRASGSPHLVGSVGRVSTLSYRLILSDKTFRPVFGSQVDPDFMVLTMNNRYYRNQVEQAISGAEGLANNLPLSSLRAFFFAIPPLPEQRTIVKHLLAMTEGTSRMISRIETEISLLHEYRNRLVADVVTGKLDVRKAAANLPDEAKDTDLMEDPISKTEEALDEEPVEPEEVDA